MWIPIFKQNKHNISDTLSQYIDNLNNFKSKLSRKFDELHDQLLEINGIRQIFRGHLNETTNNKENGK